MAQRSPAGHGSATAGHLIHLLVNVSPSVRNVRRASTSSSRSRCTLRSTSPTGLSSRLGQRSLRRQSTRSPRACWCERRECFSVSSVTSHLLRRECFSVTSVTSHQLRRECFSASQPCGATTASTFRSPPPPTRCPRCSCCCISYIGYTGHTTRCPRCSSRCYISYIGYIRYTTHCSRCSSRSTWCASRSSVCG